MALETRAPILLGVDTPKRNGDAGMKASGMNKATVGNVPHHVVAVAVEAEAVTPGLVMAALGATLTGPHPVPLDIPEGPPTEDLL